MSVPGTYECTVHGCVISNIVMVLASLLREMHVVFNTEE